MKHLFITLLSLSSLSSFSEVIASGETAEKIYQKMDVEEEYFSDTSKSLFKIGKFLTCEYHPGETEKDSICYINH